jgi:hypothetical protein
VEGGGWRVEGGGWRVEGGSGVESCLICVRSVPNTSEKAASASGDKTEAGGMEAKGGVWRPGGEGVASCRRMSAG